MITRKSITTPEFYKGYIQQITEDQLIPALEANTRRFMELLKAIPGEKIDYAYAPGKWTIRELLQHVIDSERVFSYRALSFARKDPAPLPGFDENMWAVTAKAGNRKWNDMIREFAALREANMAFFASLDEEQLLQSGTANNNTMSVAALGFVCAGHVAHHMRIITERYLGEEG